MAKKIVQTGTGSKKAAPKKATPKKSVAKPGPYGATKFANIDQYHRQFPAEIQVLLEQIRSVIRKAAPEAVEEISYNMPAFRQGKVLVYYAANKEHLGFYPTPGPLMLYAADLAKYKSSKGAVQFPYNQKLPVSLIEKMVKFRVKEEMARAKKK
ncbi:MAG: DUF1801 domain-containing protein [Flavobacteriales bacterium]|nr:DUF1801 domain-containing protein [Flavobacteriales bacterium]